jgi:hypothetical protein
MRFHFSYNALSCVCMALPPTARATRRVELAAFDRDMAARESVEYQERSNRQRKPWAVELLSAHHPVHRHVLNHSYARTYI